MDNRSNGKPRIAVIGAGLSGLGVSWLLDRRGADVTVLERAERVGGAVRTERVDGFLCEAGPNSMMLKSATAESFLDQAGLMDDVVATNPGAEQRFLVKDGRVVPMPAGPGAALTTPLYSWRAKLRLLKEPFVRPAPADADESVASFVTRRMGREFLDYGIAALVSGIYAGDPERLSIRHAFPKVWNLEARYGSLIGGALKLARERRRSGETPYKSRLLSFADGMETLTRKLAESSGARILTGAEVDSIGREDGRWRLRWRAGDGPAEGAFDALIVAVQAHALNALPWPDDLRSACDALPSVSFPPVTTLVLGYRREQVGHPLDGFGMLIPFPENKRVLGAIFSSTLFPGRAPEGHVSLMIFLGGARMPECARADLDEAVALAQGELADLLGITGEPVFARHHHWPRAIPQYNVGHGDFIAALEGMERRWPGLHFCANFRGGPGIADCIDSALRTSERVVGALDGPAPAAEDAAWTTRQAGARRQPGARAVESSVEAPDGGKRATSSSRGGPDA
jgi:oxygen-dependent protoporphyrinogen oxidase